MTTCMITTITVITSITCTNMTMTINMSTTTCTRPSQLAMTTTTKSTTATNNVLALLFDKFLFSVKVLRCIWFTNPT